jgi:hypothetical protein
MNRPQPFRQHHVTKALRGAAAAGMKNPSVEVRLLPGGASIVICDNGPTSSTPPGAARKAPTRAQPASRRQP